MSAVDRNHREAMLRRDARRWVAQLVSGEARATDLDAAERWRNQSSAHEAAFAEAINLWQDFGPAGRVLLEKEGPPIWHPARPQMSRRAVLGGAGALVAASAAYAMVDPPFALWPSLAELRADYRTKTGEQRRLILKDDVSVEMNTQTSLVVPATGADEITLIAGEASFVVAHRSARPLAVVAESGRTIANEARFDIRKSGAAVCVTCLEGEVRVEFAARAAIVGANRALRYDRSGLGETVSVNPADVSAWRQGVLIFRYAPLNDVVAEINRYRPGRIILLNTALGSKLINGRFQIARIDEILVWIEQVAGAKSRELPGGIVLLT
ncbi:MAG: FecR domain-containing protein [Pseudomonadota bacterium]